MSVIINYTRLTTSDRLSDRFLTCQIYSPQDEETRNKGAIYTDVEILNPWFSASQVGQSIINTLIRDYYKADDTSDLNNFETAIKGVNEALAQVAQGGETDWIGKLSSVLVLINNKEAHFAQTGQAHAYLYRGDKINHITEGLENEASPHPLKTFTNLTSGTLQENDKVIIASPTFFEMIDPSELKMIVIQNHPTQAAVEAGKILKGRGIKYANAIFMEVITRDALANIPPDQKIDTVYINEQLSSLSTNLKNIWRNLVLPLMVAIKSHTTKAYFKSKKNLAPKIKEGFSQTADSSRKLFQSAKQKSIEAARVISEKRDKKGLEDSSTSKFSEKVKLLSIKLKNKFKRFLLRIGFSKPHGPRIYLIALASMIVILAIAIGFSMFSKNNREKNKSLQEKLNQIVSLEGEASILLVKNDDAGALTKYKQILSLSEELKNSKYKDQTSESTSKAYSKILELTQAKEIGSLTSRELPLQPIALVKTDSAIYLMSQDKKILNLANDKIFDLAQKITGEIVQMSAVEDKIAFSTKDNILYLFDPKDENTTKQDVALNYTGEMNSFFDNLYILDPPSNQIWKIINDDGYKENTPYLTDESLSIADAVDFAIDGSVYIIGQSCGINRISRGKSISDFTIALPAGEILDSCSRIFTNEDSNSLFVIGKSSNISRLVELRKNGTFINQYILKDINCDKGCFVDIAKNTFYQIENNILKSSGL